jgi:hypothetical protein
VHSLLPSKGYAQTVSNCVDGQSWFVRQFPPQMPLVHVSAMFWQSLFSLQLPPVGTVNAESAAHATHAITVIAMALTRSCRGPRILRIPIHKSGFKCMSTYSTSEPSPLRSRALYRIRPLRATLPAEAGRCDNHDIHPTYAMHSWRHSPNRDEIS